MDEKSCRGCVCMGAGPVFSELLRKLGPDEQVRQHFRNARIEVLKGLRAMIDARISDLSKGERRGAKVTVE
jgi:hypothetical protein